MTPVPAFTVGPRGGSRLFLICDHAVNWAPPGLLGLEADAMASHIAFDPGALALTEALAQRFEAHAFACGFSRLIIDPNRDLERADSIPERSGGVAVPGNADLADAERRRRWDTYYRPYHRGLADALAHHCETVARPFIFSVHTFTPVLLGEERPWEMGVLWREDAASAHALLDGLARAAPAFVLGDNEPYSGALYNHTVDRHLAGARTAHATIEVRQDLLADPGEAARAARILGDALAPLVAD